MNEVVTPGCCASTRSSPTASAARSRLGRLLRVPGASHYPHVERAEMVNAALRDFFGTAGADCRAGL